MSLRSETFFTHAVALVRLPSIAEDSTAASCRSLGRVSVPVADHPLRPAMYRRLGEPLPHQLANTPVCPSGSDAIAPLPNVSATSTLMRY